jgi:hypothetical protein
MICRIFGRVLNFETSRHLALSGRSDLTATAMMRQYQQPDSMNQILQQTSDRLNVALDLIQRAES